MMKYLLRYSVFYAVLILCTNQIHAQGFLYQKSFPNEPRNYEKYVKNTSVFADSMGVFDFEQIVELGKKAEKFVPKDSIQLAMPQISTYWIKFQIKKPLDSNLVVVFNPAFTLVEYYKPERENSKSSPVEKGGFSIYHSNFASKYVPDIVFLMSKSDTSEWHYFKIIPFKLLYFILKLCFQFYII